MGFCYLNNVAIAALEAAATGSRRVAVFDLDMSVEVSLVSEGRGRIFLSLPSSVAQGVSLVVALMLFKCCGFFRKTATFMRVFIK